MQHTLGTASKATGKSRSTILRAIKDGKISANKDHNGNYAIDPSELHRVFSPVVAEQQQEKIMTLHATALEQQKEQVETPILLEKIKGLETALEREQKYNEDLKEDRDKWREQATQLLLTNQTEKSSQLTTELKQEPQDHKILKQVLYFVLFASSVLIAYGLGKAYSI